MTAYKNRGIQTEHHWKELPLLVTMTGMICSLLISRGALSVTTILFLLLAIVRKDFKQQWKTFLTNYFLLLFTLLFFIPFVSGLWSENLSKWSDVIRLKLPLLFFPLAFAGRWNFSKKGWLLIAAVFIAVVFIGCTWSLFHYFQNMASVHEGYLRAKTLLTPLENDHVRFSWLVSIAVMICVLLPKLGTQKTATVFLWGLAVFFAGYLHILSARTGMISLYIFLCLYGLWTLRSARKKKPAFLFLGSLILLPLLAYRMVPTFQNRIRYFIYDFSFVQKAEYLPGTNDGARVMSLKAGWQVVRQNPLGVGAGDVMQEANKWYQANVPQVLETDKFYPSSQWLLYGAFAGWPGILLFTLVMLLPFFQVFWRHQIFWISLQATAAFSFLFDMGLEVQYGIFLYALLNFWWWKWLKQEP
jgi:hypothetical protein